MAKILNKTEMAEMAVYEFELQAAMADYLRSAGRIGLEAMKKIYKRVTGDDYTRTDSCGHCQLTLQKFVARWYFETKEYNEAHKK